jgi:glutamyl-tRNA synthetase
LSRSEQERLRAEGRTCVIRFAVPTDRAVSFTDLILGPVGQQTKDINDFVIARADGSPLYNFASVVDDIEMQITHVIRAQEHLTNTYSQWLIFEALGATMPAFAHVPYVAAPGSKEKISKRKLEPFRALMTPEIQQKFRDLGWRDDDAPNPVMLSYYEELGYLPDAMLNGLARIGWSLDDKQEKISRTELLANFSLERVNAAPASFDPDKLWWLQGEYMKELPIEQKIDGVIRPLQKAKLLGRTTVADVDSGTRHKLCRIIEAAGDRLKIFTDVLTYGAFFFVADDQLKVDTDAMKTLKKDYVPALLPKLSDLIAAAEPFDAPTLEARVRELAESTGLGAGKVIHALRAATSGQSVGPGVFELAAILGKESCLRRIDRTITMLSA